MPWSSRFCPSLLKVIRLRRQPRLIAPSCDDEMKSKDTLAANFVQSDFDDPFKISKKLDETGGLTAGVTASATEGGLSISIGETSSFPSYIS